MTTRAKKRELYLLFHLHLKRPQKLDGFWSKFVSAYLRQGRL